MLWSEAYRRSAIVFLAGNLLIAAAGSCGFRPLYADNPGGGNVSETLASVSVPEATDRLHQLVRNELVLNGMSQSEGIALYKLDYRVIEAEADVLVQRSSLVERRVLQLNLTFKLSDGTKKPVVEGKNAVKVAYNRTASEFNNLRAQKDARERAAKRVAQMLQTRLAAWLSQNRPKG